MFWGGNIQLYKNFQKAPIEGERIALEATFRVADFYTERTIFNLNTGSFPQQQLLTLKTNGETEILGTGFGKLIEMAKDYKVQFFLDFSKNTVYYNSFSIHLSKAFNIAI